MFNNNWNWETAKTKFLIVEACLWAPKWWLCPGPPWSGQGCPAPPCARKVMLPPDKSFCNGASALPHWKTSQLPFLKLTQNHWNDPHLTAKQLKTGPCSKPSFLSQWDFHTGQITTIPTGQCLQKRWAKAWIGTQCHAFHTGTSPKESPSRSCAEAWWETGWKKRETENAEWSNSFLRITKLPPVLWDSRRNMKVAPKT